ncbi:transmembrane protein, putative (macronuclear) [Tetrahymena thermophila SB210]|uniref:Transmembrane protein, putative n=1 Tax=Tetrahymena thermophila (strain SB210) TaxID=312017 RepID=Q23NG7_TETTS|nr:transmembrane protein, putative [Tetrahymena thermophila SB210]EAR98107.1 transmembrane protein, putative [Tetrahymena thermophila SB210]|eukprot:XP_001018352.1 transmembrane protein, putative [Tetrahymena thermophila SB210]
MKQFALLFLAFVAINTVNAYISQDQINQFNNCTDNIKVTCTSENIVPCRNSKIDIDTCLKSCIGDLKSQTMGGVKICFDQSCLPIAKNSTIVSIQQYGSQLDICLSSGIISFAFILLAVIVSVLFVQH